MARLQLLLQLLKRPTDGNNSQKSAALNNNSSHFSLVVKYNHASRMIDQQMNTFKYVEFTRDLSCM